MKQIWYQKSRIAIVIGILLLMASCIDGFKDDETFSAGVSNTTLLPPDSLTFTKSLDGSKLIVQWPVVYGAGGYEFTVYNIYNPDSVVIVGDSSRLIDGCSASFNLEDETKYKIVVRTAANAVANNKASEQTTTGYYSTLLFPYDTIPDNTDLYTYFQEHPIPASDTTLVYDLMPNGHYTMSGDIYTKMTPIMFRGNKKIRPELVVTKGQIIFDGAETTLLRVNVDCSSSTTGLLTVNKVINSSVNSSAWGGGIIYAPIGIKSCKITGLNAPLLSDNSTKYALASFLIKDCIIGQNTATQNLLFGTMGYIKDIAFMNSTFYNLATASSGYLIQVANGSYATKITGAGWSVGSISITNCTLWNISNSKKYINYSGWNNVANSYTLEKNIFVDCSDKNNGMKMSDPFGLNSTTLSKASYKYNTYWITSGSSATVSGSYPGCPISEIVAGNAGGYDNSGNAIKSDPQFVSPSTGDFTVRGAEQIENATGDPRWIPVVK